MFKLEKDFTYSMPAHFGGIKFDPEVKLTQKATTILISYETEEKLLENYIPEVFELLAPEVQVIFSEFREINWMLGGHYNLIDVSVPVRFNGKKDELDGKYSLVVWENNNTREQTGIPKIYADIEDLHILKPHYATTASFDGNTFLNMNFEATGELTGDEFEQVKANVPKFGHHWVEIYS
jgi:acetoacetate decarboxylase